MTLGGRGGGPAQGYVVLRAYIYNFSALAFSSNFLKKNPPPSPFPHPQYIRAEKGNFFFHVGNFLARELSKLPKKLPRSSRSLKPFLWNLYDHVLVGPDTKSYESHLECNRRLQFRLSLAIRPCSQPNKPWKLIAIPSTWKPVSHLSHIRCMR